jgi:iron(III) transport system permease protein
VDGVANTFVYTVLLMVITGVTMYLVYGRSRRGRSRKKRLPAAPVPGPGLPGTPVSGEDAVQPAAPVR